MKKLLFLLLLLTSVANAEYTAGDYIVDIIGAANNINVVDMDSAIQKESMFKFGIKLWYGTDYKNDIPRGMFSAYPTQDQLTSLSLIDSNQLTIYTIDNYDKWVFARVWMFIINTHNGLDFTGQNQITSPFDPNLPLKYKNRMNFFGNSNSITSTNTLETFTMIDYNTFRESVETVNTYQSKSNSEKNTYLEDIKSKFVAIENYANNFYTSKCTIEYTTTESRFQQILSDSTYNTICIVYSDFDSSFVSRVDSAFNAGKFIVVVFPSRMDNPAIVVDKLYSYSLKMPFFIIGWSDEISNTLIVPDQASAEKERLAMTHKEVDVDYKETMKAVRSNKDIIVKATGKPVFIHMRQFRETINAWLNALEFVPDGVAISAFGSTNAEFTLSCEMFYKYDAPKTFKNTKILFISIEQQDVPRKVAEIKAENGGAIGIFYELKGTGNDF